MVLVGSAAGGAAGRLDPGRSRLGAGGAYGLVVVFSGRDAGPWEARLGLVVVVVCVLTSLSPKEAIPVLIGEAWIGAALYGCMGAGSPARFVVKK
jgi:hypothetical protein